MNEAIMETFKMTREVVCEITRNLNVDERLTAVLVDRLFGRPSGFGIENRDQAVAFVVKQLQTLYS